MHAKIKASIAVNTRIKNVLFNSKTLPLKISMLTSNKNNKIQSISDKKKNFWIEKNEFSKQKIEITKRR